MVVARKPFDGTVEDNVLKHGTGALNMKETRIGDEELREFKRGTSVNTGFKSGGITEAKVGRHMSNVIVDEEVSRMIEKQHSGASKFYYVAKANPAERTVNGLIDNKHPTVKPIELMKILVKLTTMKGQTVLDMFAGTGTTLHAAQKLDRNFIGIEKDEVWADVSRVRLGMEPNNKSNVYNSKASSLFDQ